MIVIKTYAVNKCGDCPHYTPSMEGPYCIELAMQSPTTHGYVYPAGRTAINPLCPLKREEINVES